MAEEVPENVLIERAAKQNYLITEIIQQDYDSDLFTWYISSLKEADIDIWTLNELQVIVNDFKSKYSPGQTLESIQSSIDSSIEAKQDYLRKEIIDQSFDPDLFLSYIEKIKAPELDNWSYEELKTVVSQFKAEYKQDHIHISPVNKSGRNSLYGSDLEGIKVNEIIDGESENNCGLFVKNEETFRSISPFPLHKTLSSDGNIVFEPIYLDESHSNDVENEEVGKEDESGERTKESDNKYRNKSEILEDFENKFQTKSGDECDIREGTKGPCIIKAENCDDLIGLTPVGPDPILFEIKTGSFDFSESQNETIKISPKNARLEIESEEFEAYLSSPEINLFKITDKNSAEKPNTEIREMIQIDPMLEYPKENPIYPTSQVKPSLNEKEEIPIQEHYQNEFLVLNKQEISPNLPDQINSPLSGKVKINDYNSEQDELLQSQIPEKISVHLSEHILLNIEELSDQIDPSLKILEQGNLAPQNPNPEKNQENTEEIFEYSQISIIQCQSINFTELTFLSDIKFTCGFPEIIKTGFFSKKYTEYQITIPDLNSSVKRRYSDFYWLRSILLLTNPGSYIPPIPKKRVKNRFSSNFIKNRQQMLNKFLTTVLRDPNLRSSPYTLSFLKDQILNLTQKIPKKIENFNAISSIEGETFCDFSKDSCLIQVFSDFLTVSFDLENTLKHTSKNLIKSTKKLSQHIQEMGEIVENLEEIQDFLPNNEKNSELFRSLKDCLVKWAAHEEINSNNFETDFRDFFGYRVKERRVMKDLVEDRNMWVEKLNIVEKKNKNKGNNLSEFENVRNMFGFMNYKVKNEFDRVIGDQVIYDFEHFKMVAKKEIDKCESLEALWMGTSEFYCLNNKFL